MITNKYKKVTRCNRVVHVSRDETELSLDWIGTAIAAPQRPSYNLSQVSRQNHHKEEEECWYTIAEARY